MIRVIRIATVLASALVLFAGCENLLTGESYAPPTDVEVSTGEFRDRIEIEWKAPPARETSDGKTIGVEWYQVHREKWDSGDSEWKDDPIGFANDTTTDTSFTDEWVVPGVAYRYRIVAEFEDGNKSDSSEYAEGYALDARRLILYSNETDGRLNYSVSGSNDAWFEFSAQNGWPYRITVTGTPGIEVFARGNIREPVAEPTVSGTYPFPAPQTTVYHIRVSGNGTGTISVWY